MNIRSLLTTGILFSVSLSSQLVAAGEISASDRASLRVAYEAGRHAAVETEQGFEARNHRQAWNVTFDARGFLVEPDASDWRWGLELESYGFGRSEREVGELACVSAEGGRVAYQWDDTLEEWFVNDARGVEHGFTIRERSDDMSGTNDGPLWFTLRVRGGLTAKLHTSRTSVAFLDDVGQIAVSYSGLTVFDSDGELVPAWFESHASGFRIAVNDEGARYPLTIDPIAQEAYFKASNPDMSDRFGRSVAFDGDTVVIGALDEDSNASGVNGDQLDNSKLGSGAAYVFVRSGSTWVQQAYLKSSNPDTFDGFGISLGLSGDTLAVSAHLESSDATGINGDQSNNNSSFSGAVYVFVRSGSTWAQQAYIKASNTDNGAHFGTDIALDGNTLVVGARFEDSGATGVNGDDSDQSAPESGAAYIYVRSGTTWTQQAYLKASNTGADDRFGTSVDIWGNRVVVGAYYEDSNATGVNGDEANDSASNSGAAYVFKRAGTTWSQDAYLKASNPGADDNFGSTVSIFLSTVIVGAEFEDSDAQGIGGDGSNNNAVDSGAAYVFDLFGFNWNFSAYLKSSNSDVSDRFGAAVCVWGDSAAVGAPFEGALNTGGCYLFSRTFAGWSEDAYVKPQAEGNNDRFGVAVALSGTALLVGASGEDSSAVGVNGDATDNSLGSSGAAYWFDVVAPFASVCSGDGGDQVACTNCPCSNNAPAATVGGCLNSAGTSAELRASGDTSVTLPPGSTSDLRFGLSGAPPLAFCILNSGDGVAPGNAANPCFGLSSGAQAASFDGLRCAIMNTRRHGGRSADANGEIGITNNPWGGEGGPPVGIAVAGGGFAAGQTRFFQVINRDDPLLSCMRGLNTSQAVEVLFAP